MSKVFIDTELWYIPNFLTQEELSYIEPFCDDEKGWYTTSRSRSIKNKFINVKYKLYEEGTICPTRGIDLSNTAVFPTDEERINHPIFYSENGLLNRMRKELPETLVPDITLQSFWPLNESDIGGAYNWHYEKGMAAEIGNEDFDDGGMTAAWSIYLNNNFEGGVLEFLYKPYKIYPQPGMLISIPMTKEFTHRVTPVTSGVRHTIYGVCYEDLEKRFISNSENC